MFRVQNIGENRLLQSVPSFVFPGALAVVFLFFSSIYADEIVREPLVLQKGGTPEKPAVFDGEGMIIDLGIDVTSRSWKKNGDVWTSAEPIPERPPATDVQRAGMFIEEVPLRVKRDHAAERAGGDADKVIYIAPDKLAPGEMGFTAAGCLYFRWPASKPPGSAAIILPPEKLTNCVSIACSHIIVRNITVRHAANDGFNIHGHRTGIRLENVKALSNGDEGISAHETVQMDVFDSEIAWNGSDAGGVADVNESVTSYTNCVLHHNLGAAFFFAGKSHRVTNCLIHHQAKDMDIRGETRVEETGLEWRRE